MSEFDTEAQKMREHLADAMESTGKIIKCIAWMSLAYFALLLWEGLR